VQDRSPGQSVESRGRDSAGAIRTRRERDAGNFPLPASQVHEVTNIQGKHTMKTATIVAAACLLALAGTAQAQQARMGGGGTSPLYGELGYSHLDARGSIGGAGLSGHPGLIRAIVGYDVHPNAAIEGMLGFGIRDAKNDGQVLGLNYNANFRVRSTLGLFVKPKMDFGNVEVFGRAGYAQTRLRTNLVTGVGSSGSNESNGDFAYGVGANWRFNPNVYAGLDLMRYYDKGSTRIDGVTLSIGTRW
jgi:hypothetical protein